MNTSETRRQPALISFLQRWRARLTPIAAILLIGIFIYWMWRYRELIVTTFKMVGALQLLILVSVITVSVVLSVFTFTILVREKGYTFSFADGYHSLNLSQLASMIPGKIWGFAGLTGLLLARGISKLDSVVIILVNTVVMLSACAIVGLSGIIAVIGWTYSFVFLLPFIFLILSRSPLEKLRLRYYPLSSPLPSATTLLKVLALGILVWLMVSSSFSWFLFRSQGQNVVPFWTATGAYAAAYLGGFISLLAPSGIGVSEGLMVLILGPYFDSEKVLAAAISFRIIHTFVLWINILITFVTTSLRSSRAN